MNKGDLVNAVAKVVKTKKDAHFSLIARFMKKAIPFTHHKTSSIARTRRELKFCHVCR